MYNKRNKAIVSFTRFLAGLYGKIFMSLEVKGRENIPSKGHVIIASNHLSYWDPPLIAATARRYLFFMGKESLLTKPVFGWYMGKLGTYPVKRGTADFGAYKATIKFLKMGEALLMFPEGTRGDWMSMGKAKTGIGSIACFSGAPVVPAIVTYSKRIKPFRFLKARLEYGKPIYFDRKANKNKEGYLEFGREIIRKIKKLDVSGFYE